MFDKELYFVATKKQNKDILESFKDRQKLKKYLLFFFALPLLLLVLGYLSLEHFIPLNLTVKIQEVRKIPSLPFQKGSLTLYYSDKSEHQMVEGESALFKDIASKYRGEKGRLVFLSKGYETIDTIIILGNVLRLPIKRDDSLAKISGVVTDENGEPLKEVYITVQDLETETDDLGRFSISIPLELQREEQQLIANKDGFQVWEFTGPPSQVQDWMIVLKKH